MSAKKDAKELVKLFENGLTVKDCALIALEWAEFYADEAYRSTLGTKQKMSYFEEVKHEIENL